MKQRKTLQRILAGAITVRFDEMVGLVEAFGFSLSRTNGSHHIFSHPEIPELINLQNVRGQVKPYQVRQLLKLVERHNLSLEDT